ncbi:abequosyltransferase RfbV [Lachnospiraceae bacterium]|nr:abequosyltransferase RfbV [Lachnospiraceae bacterium]
MKLLSICIPNYNRIDKLERLLREAASQIIDKDLTKLVEICVSDDCSLINPQQLIDSIRKEYAQVGICFRRNKENRGMDYNFLNSVMMASSEYCWIIGNDDMPNADSIFKVITFIKLKPNTDIFLTPFDVYDNKNIVRTSIYPLRGEKEIVFDTSIVEQYSELLLSVRHNSGLFGFLSNVVFLRRNWEKYRECFLDKLNTIFIQMYMNIQTLKDGAIFRYIPDKIVKNYTDDKTNESIERICRILIGLDGVVEYFFDGIEKEHLKRIIVDAYISGRVWDLPDKNIFKENVRAINSPKNKLYKKYFVPIEVRKNFLLDKQILIYGAGEYGHKVYKELMEYNATIIGVADSAESKKGLLFEGFKIMTVEEMVELYTSQELYVLVANHFYLEEMIATLQDNKIKNIGIIS